MKFFHAAFIISLILFCPQIYSQSKVFFYAVDEAKEPLDMVGITIADDNQEYYNQTVMYFPTSIELAKGKYYITATKYGYLQKTDTFLINNPEQIITIVLKKVVEQVSLGAVKSAPQNLQPGSIYVIDREFIDAMGARDITDVLMTVPGFSLAVDVLGNISNSTRGVWTNEGKFLFMLDGMMLNELAYGTIQLGQRFPIDNIEKIEILRGPASTINGGLASYGVINIITKNHTGKDKISFTSFTGKTDNHVSRMGTEFLYNQKLSDVSFINLSGYLGRGQRSDKTYTAFDGNSYNMWQNSGIQNEQIIMNAGYKSFRIKGFIDNYQTFQRDAYGLNAQRAYPVRYPVAGLQLLSTIDLNRYWKFTPMLSLTSQKPYSEKNVILDSIDSKNIGRSTLFDFTTINRLSNNFTLSYASGNRVDIDFRAEYIHDFFKNNEELFPNSLNTFEMESLIGIGSIKISMLDPYRLNQKQAFYIQGAIRAEKQTYYSAVVPQASATILSGSFHTKLLFGQSFRPPLLENIRLNMQNNGGNFTLKPEFTNTYEIELGFDIGKKSFITLNAFNNKTSGAITYISDAIGNENYINGQSIGSSGLELHCKFAMSAITWYLNASMYQALRGDSHFLVPNTSTNFGIPGKKLNSILSFDLEDMMNLSNTHLNLMYTILDKQYQYTSSTGTFGTVSPKHYFNTVIDIKNINESGLNLTFGIYDMFNQGIYYVQPYNGGHATLPGLGREYLLKIAYELPIK
jgi:outer membrane cobalamin receptor